MQDSHFFTSNVMGDGTVAACNLLALAIVAPRALGLATRKEFVLREFKLTGGLDPNR